MQKLWFKRKLYGWGWTPVTWQGWLIVLGYIILVVAIILMREKDISGNPDSGSNFLVFGLPIFVLTTMLMYICYKKGEKPRWQWGKRIDDKPQE
jgi:hypothetical protein